MTDPEQTSVADALAELTGRDRDVFVFDGGVPAFEDQEVRNGGLECPDPSCDERFRTYHDENAITTMVYHLDKEHPGILRGLKVKLGAPIDD